MAGPNGPGVALAGNGGATLTAPGRRHLHAPPVDRSSKPGALSPARRRRSPLACRPASVQGAVAAGGGADAFGLAFAPPSCRLRAAFAPPSRRREGLPPPSPRVPPQGPSPFTILGAAVATARSYGPVPRSLHGPIATAVATALKTRPRSYGVLRSKSLRLLP